MSSTLDDTALAAALHRLADRLDRIEAKVDAIDDSVEILDVIRQRLPAIADAAATTAQFALDQAVPADVNPVSYAVSVAEIGKKAAHPDNVQLLARLLDRADDLTLLLDLLARMDGALSASGLDRRVVAEKTVDMMAMLAKVATSPEAEALMKGGALEKESIDTLRKTTEALVATRREAVVPVGLFGALGKMGDPDVQKAVGFSLALAKELGRRL